MAQPAAPGSRAKSALWIATALAAAGLAGFFTRGQPSPAEAPALAERVAPATSAPAPATPAAPNAATVAVAPAAPAPSEPEATTEPAVAPAVPVTSAPAAAVTPAARGQTTARSTRPAPPAQRAQSNTGRESAAAQPAAPSAMGTVQLAVSPWGHVEVNGAPAGIAPPLTRLTLPEGTHTITLRNDDFPPFSTTVQVSADKPVSLRHRFAP